MSCQTFPPLFRPLSLPSAHDTSPAAGSRPSAASQVRLVIAIIGRSPPCLRSGVVVVRVILHRPQQHHGVVLVNRVVAVHGIVPPEVPEAHHQLDLLVELQPDDVLPGEFDVPPLDQLPVAPDDLELLQVNVDRVLPAPGVVLQDPPFRRVPVHREADLVAVEELPVDLPLAVAPLEAEPARDPRGRPRGQGVEPHRRVGRVYAVVAHAVAHEPELHEHVLALAGGQDLARRAPAVYLLEAILQPQPLDAEVARERLEVDDDVYALRNTDAGPAAR